MTSTNSPQEYEGIGVSDEHLGAILQRGGEELPVEKVPDRFTVRLVAQTVPGAEWSGAASIQSTYTVAPLSSNPVQELTVAPENLNQVMETARGSDQVLYASHVYRLPGTPGLFYLTNQMTIQFAANVDPGTFNTQLAELGLKQLKRIEEIANAYVYILTAESQENPIKISNRLMRYPEIITAEPNIIVGCQTFYQPRDSLYRQQWYLNHSGGSQLALNSHIAAEQAWDITRGNRSIVIAIADDSVDLNHPDFQGKGKIVAPLDLKDNDFIPMPGLASDNHGTSCAGVAVAEENGVGVVGVAPGCALMPIRTTGFLDDESVEKIFNWIIDKGAAVASCSWGASAVYFPLSMRQRTVINKAATQGRKGKGCVIVFAAGNANRPVNGVINETGWPNNVIYGSTRWMSGFTVHPDVITVAACTSLNRKAVYSNWGASISVCAPSNNAPPGMWLQETGYILTPPQVQGPLTGLGVFTTDRLGAGGYDQTDFTGGFGGTSSATPVVAGVAGLVLSINPDLTAAQVRRVLETSADKIVDPNADIQLGTRLGTYDSNGHSQWFGYGKVNAFKAVQTARQQRSSVQQPSRRIQAASSRSVAIPDNDPTGAVSSIYVAEVNTVWDIQVSIEITHTFLGDIEIQLVHPRGEMVLLQNRTLGRNTELKTTYNLQTTPLLRKFLSLSAQGNWKLVVIDRAPFDSGTLTKWQLNLGI